MTTEKKAAGKKATSKKASGKSEGPRGMPAKGKDPKGGLTAAGRAFFKEKDGSNLRPGVKGAADTPEKMLRKGSFLRRHYANPPGPVVDDKGQPTRQALEAAAWGEPVPKSEGDEKKLAEKGSELLERYHAAKGDAPKKAGGSKGSAGTTTAGKKTSAKKVARKTAKQVRAPK